MLFPAHRNREVLRGQVKGAVRLARPDDGERSDHVDLLPNRVLELEWNHSPGSIPNPMDARTNNNLNRFFMGW